MSCASSSLLPRGCSAVAHSRHSLAENTRSLAMSSKCHEHPEVVARSRRCSAWQPYLTANSSSTPFALAPLPQELEDASIRRSAYNRSFGACRCSSRCYSSRSPSRQAGRDVSTKLAWPLTRLRRKWERCILGIKCFPKCLQQRRGAKLPTTKGTKEGRLKRRTSRRACKGCPFKQWKALLETSSTARQNWRTYCRSQGKALGQIPTQNQVALKPPLRRSSSLHDST
jgi:hypothetical protein